MIFYCSIKRTPPISILILSIRRGKLQSKPEWYRYNHCFFRAMPTVRHATYICSSLIRTSDQDLRGYTYYRLKQKLKSVCTELLYWKAILKYMFMLSCHCSVPRLNALVAKLLSMSLLLNHVDNSSIFVWVFGFWLGAEAHVQCE